MNHSIQNSKNKKYRQNSLIEALRGLGSSASQTLSQDLLEKMPDDFFRQTGLAGNIQNHEQIDDRFSQEGSETSPRVIRRLQQERIIFNGKERETKTQVSILLTEVQKLSTAVVNLDQTVQRAVVAEPAAPGIYHVHFFERLVTFIKSLTEKINDANLWLNSSQQKSKKRSFYWAQVQKSGSKFMLSQERYMSTQAG